MTTTIDRAITTPGRNPPMRRILTVLVAAATLTGCASKLDITNPNNPSQGTAALNPRDASIRLIVGVFATYRSARAGSINSFGSYGRETYNMTPQDGRSVTGPYRDWAQNNAFTAGSEWGRYGNYRNIYEVSKLIANTPDGPITAEEKKGAFGVLKTFLALEMLHIIEARGAIGAVVDMTDDPTAVLPFVSEDSVYKWITAKLDEANTDLAGAGSTFYFPMHSGFSDFGVPANTVAGFVQFNRALKARVEAKRGSLGCGAPCYTTALTALGGSFLSELSAANRDNGVYVIYSTASGDALNGSSFAQNSSIYVHPLIDSLPGAALDDRYRRKVDTHEAANSQPEDDLCTTSYPSRSLVGANATNRPCTYAANVTPIPIIRNEELILIRAEAKWFTGEPLSLRPDQDQLLVPDDGNGSDVGGVGAGPVRGIRADQRSTGVTGGAEVVLGLAVRGLVGIHLPAVAVVQGRAGERVDERVDVDAGVLRERAAVERIARRRGVDHVDAVVAVRGAELGKERAAERGERGGVAGRAAPQRAALRFDPGLERPVELDEPGHGVGGHPEVAEPAVHREIERAPGPGEVGVGLVELGGDPLVHRILGHEGQHRGRIVGHVHHGADRAARLDDVQHLERQEGLEHAERALLLLRRDGAVGRIGDQLGDLIDVAVVAVAPPLAAGGEGVVLGPVAVGSRDAPPILRGHVVGLAPVAAEGVDGAGAGARVGGEPPDDQPDARVARVGRGGPLARIVRVGDVQLAGAAGQRGRRDKTCEHASHRWLPPRRGDGPIDGRRHGSPPQVHGEVELAGRRERREIDEAVEVGRAEVVVLRVEAPVVGEHERIARLQGQPERPAAQIARDPLRGLVAQGDVAHPHVGAVFEVGADVAAVRPGPVPEIAGGVRVGDDVAGRDLDVVRGRGVDVPVLAEVLGRDRLVVIPRGAAFVVQGAGHVGHVTPLAPIHGDGQGEPLPGGHAVEVHHEVGIRVAGHGVPDREDGARIGNQRPDRERVEIGVQRHIPPDPGGAAAGGDEVPAERRAERAGCGEPRHVGGQAHDVLGVLLEGGAQGPVQIPLLQEHGRQTELHTLVRELAAVDEPAAHAARGNRRGLEQEIGDLAPVVGAFELHPVVDQGGGDAALDLPQRFGLDRGIARGR